MNTPQTGIFKEGFTNVTYLELTLTSTNREGLIEKIQTIYNKEFDTELTYCFSKKAWNLLNPSWCPEELEPFKTLRNEKFEMPSTQGDLFFWIHSNNESENFDASYFIKNTLKPFTIVALDLKGFVYHNSRDLTGFEDGTANPKEEKRYDAALIPEGESGAGGSYVFTQKWIHNLAKFHSLPVKEQEAIIGRTKKDSIELEGDAMPSNSHVSRTDVKVNDEAMKIWRRSTPYGNAEEHGLYFVAFAKSPFRIQVQLERMIGITEDGIHDRLMEFSSAVTGAYWFAPSQEDLKTLITS